MKIHLATAQGKISITIPDSNLTLKKLCDHWKIPIHSMTIFATNSNGQSKRIVGVHRKLLDLTPEFESITFQPDRNIDYGAFLCSEVGVARSPDAIAEYTFGGRSKGKVLHKEMSQTECRDFVFRVVQEFIDRFTQLPDTRPIVLGISGGGDSNTFLDALVRSPKIDKRQLIAVMMLGVPDWDLGKDRALEMCNEYGVELKFVESDQVAQLMGKKSSRWAEDFESYYPEDDVEVLGTLGIRLSLLHIAEQYNAQAICTGLNLEDLLAESFLLTMKGKLPMPFPIRNVGPRDFWYPLYRIPKKILDGCNPKYSLENYQDRYPSNLIGRAIPYYLAQMQNSLVPGCEYDLIDGFQKVSALNSDYLKFDSNFSFAVRNEEISEEVISKWKRFLAL